MDYKKWNLNPNVSDTREEASTLNKPKPIASQSISKEVEMKDELAQPTLEDHSSSMALESLISQNNDLTARLSVSVRRVSILEKQLKNEAHSREGKESLIQNLQDQIFLYKEKAKASSGAYIRLQSFMTQLEDEKKSHSMEIKTYRDKVACLVKRFSFRHKTLMHVKENLLESCETLKKHSENLDIENQKTLLKLEKAIQEHALQSANYEKQITQNKVNHEEEIQNIKSNFEKNTAFLTQEKGELEDKVSKFKLNLQQFLQENIKLSNSLISREKQLATISENTLEEQNSLLAKVGGYEKEIRKIKKENSNLEQKFLEKQKKFQELYESHTKNTKELENLREMWLEAQTKSEDKEQQTIALQKLNNQLSLSLKDKKDQVKTLQDKVESSDFKKGLKMRSIKMEALQVDKSLKHISHQQELLEELERVATESQKVGLYKKVFKTELESDPPLPSEK